MEYVVGIDIGGTCTDCVVVDREGRVTLGKAFSTPPDFSRGILDAISVAADELGIGRSRLLEGTKLFLHSTTVAENAVVDGTLSRAGVITTRGFGDSLSAMRGGYGRWSGLTEDEKRNPIETDKLPPIVPGELVATVAERVDMSGEVLHALDDSELETAVRALLDKGVDALGVSFVWAFANPANEQRAKELIERIAPDKFLTVSHEIAPIVGEYERTSTVALNARLGPVVGRYLESLRQGLAAEGFDGILLVMQAYGGLLPLEEAARSPVGMIESGPVSGLVGSQGLGELIGARNIIAADMGGTTFKVGVVREGLIEYQRESMVLRYHYSLPKMDVVSLGLAGGSIISVDPRTGAPHIGPQSAGSYPGPVCYGHGGEEPTITDVDGVLGYLNPDYFLGGRETLDLEHAAQAIEQKVANPLGLPVMDAAAAMYKLANSLFFDLLHKTTVQRGLDPRGFSLFSFGGTAGMHVAAYGEEIGVASIIVPHSASVHGAFGLITSDIAHEDQITRPMHAPVDAGEVRGVFDELAQQMTAQLTEEGFEGERVALRRSIDMRYRRQVHILTVPVMDDGPIGEESLERTVELFERLYEEKYGKESAYREAGIELVSFRLRGSGSVDKPDFRVQDVAAADASHAVVKTARAWVEKAGELQDVPGYDFELMRPGNMAEGPAIVWTPITTLVVAPGQAVRVDEYKNLVLSPAKSANGLGAGARSQAQASAV